MLASCRWINDALDRPVAPDEQAERLTMSGFPIEARHDFVHDDGFKDVVLDVELTSNRGDCLCHLGLAREIAASAGRTLKPPAPVNKATGPAASTIIRVTNQEKSRCPLYTARIIRGVKVGPSPAWLASRLRAIGQIPRNNIVDATNFVLFELGQPTHVFDLSKIRGGEIIIRMARKDESFLPIGEGEKELRLKGNELAIADVQGVVALGGVKGGALSAVTSATTDLLIEAATFDPGAVRLANRQWRVESASAYRYERGVHPAQVNPAADRLVQLILELAGGTLCEGVVSDGAPLPTSEPIPIRPDRARAVLGIPVDDATIESALQRLGFSPVKHGDRFLCAAPPHRTDIEREADLIEEVLRMVGTDRIPVADTMPIRVTPPQPREAGRRALCNELAALGFVETVTHSLIDDKSARAFLSPGELELRVDDERARAEPILRPSIVPSLLRVRAINQDRGVRSLRLFELAATFAASSGVGPSHRETRRLGLLADVDDLSLGLRPLRGAIERLAHLLAGRHARLEVRPCDAGGATPSWLQPGAAAALALDGAPLGWFGVLTPVVTRHVGLEGTFAAAELDVSALLDRYPPQARVEPMPAFPAIERDVSAIVSEATTWDAIRAQVEGLALSMLEGVEFITAFRGKPIEKGRKSVTLRLRFRAADRTLKHEEVDPQVEATVAALCDGLGAVIRAGS
ncbi:MAG: phenylalanine--tRNA ligase subunit beta [Phycisphaeraceae bacterium]|nr:phenylalanine--tRNA ligase subunit beta [Phycisphaerales bacterium]QOJ18231.1 MAG: phenylalanine--tRNA ligase subunit beta [Phycisphaeraceae bacterium]